MDSRQAELLVLLLNKTREICGILGYIFNPKRANILHCLRNNFVFWNKFGLFSFLSDFQKDAGENRTHVDGR